MKPIVYWTTAAVLAATPVLSDTVTIGTVQDYDAGSYTLDPAKLKGFETALGDALCQRAELTCEWKVLPSEALWSALQSGEVDAVMAGVPSDRDVGDGIDRTMTYLMPDPFMHIGLTGTVWPPEGAVVAHLPDPAVTAYARLSGATFTEYGTIDQALAAVRNGQALSLFGEREALLPLTQASGGELDVIGVRTEVKIKPGVAMAFAAANADLRFAFEDRIFEMSEDDSLNVLTEAWFGTDAARW